MKFLQNRWLVAALAVSALVMLAINLSQPILKKRREQARLAAQIATAARAATAAPAAITNTVADSSSTNQAFAQSLAPMDQPYFRARMTEWLDNPRRDPFTAANVRRTGSAARGPVASDVLTMQATWRQTDGFVVVINGEVLTAGETILGFTVAQIETDRVLLKGPNGTEEISFAVPAGAEPLETPSPEPAPAAPKL
jgi:hypothetical protein